MLERDEEGLLLTQITEIFIASFSGHIIKGIDCGQLM